MRWKKEKIPLIKFVEYALNQIDVILKLTISDKKTLTEDILADFVNALTKKEVDLEDKHIIRISYSKDGFAGIDEVIQKQDFPIEENIDIKYFDAGDKLIISFSGINVSLSNIKIYREENALVVLFSENILYRKLVKPETIFDFDHAVFRKKYNSIDLIIPKQL